METGLVYVALVSMFFIGLVFGGIIVFFFRRMAIKRQLRNAQRKAARTVAEARDESKDILREAKEEIERSKAKNETELRERRTELQKAENRLSSKTETLDRRLESVEQRDRNLANKEKSIEALRNEVAEIKDKQLKQLEEVSGMSSEDAKQELLDRMEVETNEETSRRLREWEQKLKEVEFRAKMAQQMMATERLASLGTLATGVAHEINNPLAIMKESAGYMRLILKREELAEMPRKQDFELALTKIEGGVERARRITHQLLGAARKDDSVLSEVNLRELVNEAVQLVYREAANKDIEIIQKTDPSLNAIWSYSYQLRQVLINLLTNAIHATDSGGRITIILESVGDEAALTVRDTGEGIPRENLGRIFEPFFTTKSPDEGTGLGLFVTRGIIEKLGGAVNVESRIGHGSSFCVRLPKNDKHKDALGKNNCVDLSDK